MNWIEVTIEPADTDMDRLCSLLESLGVNGLVINDGNEFEEFLESNRNAWDYVDEDLWSGFKDCYNVTFYLPDDIRAAAEIERITSALAPFIRCFHIREVKNEDWETNWQQYYKPINVGEKLIIVPQWEPIPKNSEKLPLILNPGLIFGTGSHPTTIMCLEEAEHCIKDGDRVIDIGCGSGILAIASLILGAKEAIGCDIDPKSPDTAKANAALNGYYTLDVRFGDVLSDIKLKQFFAIYNADIVFANIVADVIIQLAGDVNAYLKRNGTFICSGIIEGRQAEVEASLVHNGFIITGHRELSGWHAFNAKIQ